MFTNYNLRIIQILFVLFSASWRHQPLGVTSRRLLKTDEQIIDARPFLFEFLIEDKFAYMCYFATMQLKLEKQYINNASFQKARLKIPYFAHGIADQASSV